jgi:hypothetical protein
VEESERGIKDKVQKRGGRKVREGVKGKCG